METILNSPAWVGVVGTLAGGFLVGCFAVLSKRMERSAEDRRFLRSKLEDLHRALCVYQLNLDLVVQKSMLSGENLQAIDVLVEAKREIFTPFAELASLYRIYAKEMNDELDAVIAAGALLLAKIGEHKGGSIKSEELLEAHELAIRTVSKAKIAIEDLMSLQRLVPLGRVSHSWRAMLRHVRRLDDRKNKKKAISEGDPAEEKILDQ